MAIVGIAALRPDLVRARRVPAVQGPPGPRSGELRRRVRPPTVQLRRSGHRPSDEDAAAVGHSVSDVHHRRRASTATTMPTSSLRAFLFDDDDRVAAAGGSLRRPSRRADHSWALDRAEAICATIAADLRTVMARTERLAATPDRDGMLHECDALVSVEPDDLRAYIRASATSRRRSSNMSRPSTGRPAPTSSTSWRGTSSSRRSSAPPSTAGSRRVNDWVPGPAC